MQRFPKRRLRSGTWLGSPVAILVPGGGGDSWRLSIPAPRSGRKWSSARRRVRSNCEMLRVLQSLVESEGDGGGPLLVRGVRLDEPSHANSFCARSFFCLLQRPKAPERVAETAAAGAFRPTGGTKTLGGEPLELLASDHCRSLQKIAVMVSFSRGRRRAMLAAVSSAQKQVSQPRAASFPA